MTSFRPVATKPTPFLTPGLCVLPSAHCLLQIPKGLSHGFMEAALPSTELVQMGSGINSAFVQMLKRRKKILRQAWLEPVASEAHSTASFHWDIAEYLPWSTLECFFWPGYEPTLWYSKPDLYPQSWTFSVWSCLLKPLFIADRICFITDCYTQSWKMKGILVFSGRTLSWRYLLHCGQDWAYCKNICSSLFGLSTGAEGPADWSFSAWSSFTFFCSGSHIIFVTNLHHTHCVFYNSV